MNAIKFWSANGWQDHIDVLEQGVLQKRMLPKDDAWRVGPLDLIQ